MVKKTHGKIDTQKLDLLLENDIPHLQTDLAVMDSKLDYLVDAKNERQISSKFPRTFKK